MNGNKWNVTGPMNGQMTVKRPWFKENLIESLKSWQQSALHSLHIWLYLNETRQRDNPDILSQHLLLNSHIFAKLIVD